MNLFCSLKESTLLFAICRIDVEISDRHLQQGLAIRVSEHLDKSRIGIQELPIWCRDVEADWNALKQ